MVLTHIVFRCAIAHLSDVTYDFGLGYKEVKDLLQQ